MNSKANYSNQSSSRHQGRKPSIDRIHAPYNFVPLHDDIFEPEWADKVSHDRPLHDGLSGKIDIEIVAHSPVLIGNEHVPGSGNTPGQVHFHKTPDGRYIIPGSSLRGAIRNVLEITTFSRMRFVDNTRMSIRDLAGPTKDVYRKAMVNNVHSGWLQLAGRGSWTLTPCKHVRVKHNELKKYENEFDAPRRASARDRYNRWDRSLEVCFDEEPYKRSKIGVNIGRGNIHGVLVLTGQPGPKKKADFIFYNEKKQKIPVPTASMKDFFFIHSSEDESNTWLVWKDRAMRGERVPVFYVEESGLLAIGMAGMFRLAYKHSIHDVIGHSSAEHLADKGNDLAALIFGYTDQEKGHRNLKGRVSFTPAFAQGKPQPQCMEPTILNGPKPSYFPNYLEQPQSASGKLKGNAYVTYMDSHARIRGFKRYPARQGAQVQSLTDEQKKNKKVQVQLNPLPKGSRFFGSLRFHNLKSEELGALLWAMLWGGDEKLRHSLGMGRPFGFGQVSLHIKDCDIRANDNSSAVPSPQVCMQRFETCMKAFRADWDKSEQMVHLLAMADAGKATGKDLTHMRLSTSPSINEFSDAKSAKPALVLASYTGSMPAVKCPEPRPNQPGKSRTGGNRKGGNQPPRSGIDIEAIKRKVRKNVSENAGEKRADQQKRKGVVVSKAAASKALSGEVISINDTIMKVRTSDGEMNAFPSLIQGIKAADIRVGMQVLIRGKGVYPCQGVAQADLDILKNRFNKGKS